MKRVLVVFLVGLMLATALCGCGDTPAAGNDATVSAPDTGVTKDNTLKGGASTLSKTYEIAATEPHYSVSIPDWHAEGYGCGFALNEKGNKNYAIVVACGYEAEETPLEKAFSALYTDTFNGILIQNYRAKYAQDVPETTQVKLADGSPALLFNATQARMITALR